MVRKLLVATANPGKVRELRRLLTGAPVELVTPSELGLQLDVREDGATYADNAFLKARAYRDASGLLTLADDSGLEVAALGGEPGVRSARFGGPGLDDRGRLELLLQRLEGVEEERRTARFRAVLALAAPSGEEWLFEGTCEGRIARVPRGENGFGYDPVFLLADGRTMAELREEEKDRVSHRGRAAERVVSFLASDLGEGASD